MLYSNIILVGVKINFLSHKWTLWHTSVLVFLTWKSVYEEQVEAIDTLAWLIRLSSVARLEQVLVAADAFLSARILRVFCLLCGGRMGVCLHTSHATHTKTTHIYVIGFVIDW